MSRYGKDWEQPASHNILMKQSQENLHKLNSLIGEIDKRIDVQNIKS